MARQQGNAIKNAQSRNRPYVAHELARLVANRGEDAARDHLTFDPCKPDFNLIEPGRIGRREAQVDVGMVGQKRLHRGCLMGGQVIEDDVNFLPRFTVRTTSSRKPTNSSLVRRAAVFPCTFPVRTSRAAYSESVPCR